MRGNNWKSEHRGEINLPKKRYQKAEEQKRVKYRKKESPEKIREQEMEERVSEEEAEISPPEHFPQFKKEEEEKMDEYQTSTNIEPAEAKNESQGDKLLDPLVNVGSPPTIKTIKEEERGKLGRLPDERLPIESKKAIIMENINKHQIVVISGETGCGKTTQVPQYIYNLCKHQRLPCRIICTQPRRLAAINIAKRVALEQNTRLGALVGYQVGLNSKQSGEDTKILYVTTGIFLQRLIHEQSLSSYTHIILDEVHERDLGNDFAMVAIKHLLHDNQHVKLILMSATFDTKLFANYFSAESVAKINESTGYDPSSTETMADLSGWGAESESYANESQLPEISSWDAGAAYKPPQQIKKEAEVQLIDGSAPIVDINERRYHVLEYYLEALHELIHEVPASGGFWENPSVHFNINRPAFFPECVAIATQLIVQSIHILNVLDDMSPNTYKKTILVFVPGYAEIFELQDSINQACSDNHIDKLHFKMIPLHSSIPDEEQSKVFIPPRKDQRKLIIGTNIAESSITIPDVDCVIDFCLTKENVYNSIRKSERLELNWASKASAKQRSGRAGRVKNGRVYRLVPEGFHEKSMAEFSTPEMQRCPLDKLVLQIKLWDFREPAVILGTAIQPPKLLEVKKTIKSLELAGALTVPRSAGEYGEITYIGRIYCDMPCDISITRLMLMGLVMGCPKNALIMACIMQQDKSMFMNGYDNSRRKLNFSKNCDSDPITYMMIYYSWENKFRREDNGTGYRGRGAVFRDNPAESQWCWNNYINRGVLREVWILIREIKQRMDTFGIPKNVWDREAEYGENGIFTLKLCIAGAFYPKYMVPQYKDMRLQEKLEKVYKNGGKHNPKQTVSIRNNTGIKLHAIVDHFHHYKSEISASESYGECLLAYVENSLPNINLALRNGGMKRQSANMNSLRYNYDGSAEEQLPTLKAESGYEVRFMDSITKTCLDVEWESVLSTRIEPEGVKDILYVSMDYFERGSRNVGRHVTRLGPLPMLDTILCLIFSPQVEFYSNQRTEVYEGARVKEEREHQLPFPYIFTSVDIVEINRLRGMYSEAFAGEVGLREACAYPHTNEDNSLTRMLKDLLQKKRVPRARDTEWTHLLNANLPKRETAYYQFGDNSNNNSNTLQPLRGTNPVPVPLAMRGSGSGSQVVIYPPLRPLHIREDIRYWTAEDLEEVRKDYLLLNQQKLFVIQDLAQMIKNIEIKDTYVLCRECKASVTILQNLKRVEFPDVVLFELCNNFGLDPIPDAKLSPVQRQSDFVKFIMRDFPQNINGWVCCCKGHICMLYGKDKKVYCLKESPLELRLPGFQYRNWEENCKDGLQKILEETAHLNYTKSYLPSIFECHICKETFQFGHELIKHTKSPIHKELVQEFLQD